MSSFRLSMWEMPPPMPQSPHSANRVRRAHCRPHAREGCGGRPVVLCAHGNHLRTSSGCTRRGRAPAVGPQAVRTRTWGKVTLGGVLGLACLPCPHSGTAESRQCHRDYRTPLLLFILSFFFFRANFLCQGIVLHTFHSFSLAYWTVSKEICLK